MQESFDILSSSGSYNVIVGDSLLQQVLNDHPDSIYMVDECLAWVLPKNIKKVILIQANENNKSLEKMPEVLLKMREAGVNRTSHLVAIGGGVIQDIATFTASIYMRGIPWTYMPTTLLGMADSCIGGKSSINMLGYKNLVGNFYPPENVLVDMSFAKSLKTDQIVGGLFEAAKICYARGFSNFLEYLHDSEASRSNTSRLMGVVVRSLKTKKWFIETDEFDQKERLLLNFGHTFGHALEAGTDFGISHGIAVGVGMVVAVEYAKNSQLINILGIERTDQLVQHVKAMMGEGLKNVMDHPPLIDISLVMEKFNNDKKHQTNTFRMVVPKDDGDLNLISVPRTNEVNDCIKLAFKSGLNAIDYPNF